MNFVCENTFANDFVRKCQIVCLILFIYTDLYTESHRIMQTLIMYSLFENIFPPNPPFRK